MHLPIDTGAIRLFLRLLYALIFLSAGVSKLARPQQFRQGIQDYRLIPSYLEVRLLASHILSFTVPVAELLVGICLISGFEVFPSILVATGLLAIFSSAIAMNLLRGRQDLSCHCGGVVGEHSIS